MTLFSPTSVSGIFNVQSPCPRCHTIGAAFVAHEDGWCNSETTERAHMHRYCQACHFEWKEIPLHSASGEHDAPSPRSSTS